MPRIAYLSWPAHEITGGIKMAFRHVEALRALGFAACIATADAKPPVWFQTTAPVIALQALSRSDDILVFPENDAALLAAFASWSNPKVVFCQNQFQVYRGLDGKEDYRAYGVRHVICPGEYSAAICRRRLPRSKLFVVPYPLDCSLFQPSEPKELRIAFAPRKRAHEALVIRDLFRAENPGFRAIPWVEIAQLPERDVAKVLGESALYLSLLRFEAFGLSALEALACGCVVAGFTGLGGREYANATTGFWAPEDDCIACVDQLTLATRLVVEGGERYRSTMAAGIKTAEQYHRGRFETHLKACWDTILQSEAPKLLGMQRLRAGEHEEAACHFREVLRTQPDDAYSLHALGVLAHRTNQSATAIDYLRQAIAADPEAGEIHYNLGTAYHYLGRLDEAVASYQEALRLEPSHAQACSNLGLALNDLGRPIQALPHLRRAVDLHPAYAEAHNNLGLTLAAHAQWDEAVASYRQALQLKPAYAEAHHNLGSALAAQGKPAEAAANYAQVVRLKPQSAAAHYILAVALAQLGNLAAASAAYREVIRLEPDHVEAHNDLGVIANKAGKFDEAVAHFQQVVQLRPDHVAALNNLSYVLTEQGKHEQAAILIAQALSHCPTSPHALTNRGIIFWNQGNLPQAKENFEQALRHDPHFAHAYNNLGLVLRHLGQITEALACYDRAIALDPDYVAAHVNRAHLWLLMGKWDVGWQEYEWRWRQPHYTDTLNRPHWDGAPLAGRTILLHTEQGLGDTLQFIRYAPLVKQHGGTVIVSCPKALAALLASVPGIDRLVHPGSALPDCHVHASVMSLPRILGTSYDNVPAPLSYLRADPRLVEQWRNDLRLAGTFNVGIAWQGNPKFTDDRFRSIPLGCFAPLAKVDGIRLFSLQKGYGVEQLAAARQQFPITELGSRLDTTAGAFMDTAAVMMNLDLVVSSDTVIPHLAGAARCADLARGVARAGLALVAGS